MELRMSRKERDRLKVIEQIEHGQIRQMDGTRLLRLSHRHARRLQAAYRARGDGALVHGLRGRASGRRIAPAVKARAKAFLEQRYDGVGPVLASEHLAEQIGVVARTGKRHGAGRWSPANGDRCARGRATASSGRGGPVLASWRRWTPARTPGWGRTGRLVC